MKRLDFLGATKHDVYCKKDYRLLKSLGMTTIREGLSWSTIEKKKGSYDFSRYEAMMRTGQEEGMQQIWDLNHFDYPDDLDPFSPEFISRFAAYAKACAKTIRQYQTGTLYLVPINEISFWSFMGATIAMWAPHRVTRGYWFKKQLVAASIAAMDSIWEDDPNVRFIQVDPIMYKTFKEPETPVKRAGVAMFREIQFQTFDMLSGRVAPELGGHPRYLDIIGSNYYPNNQDWITEDCPEDETCHEPIPWHSRKRVSFADLLSEIYDRYHRPILVSETGAWGSLRATFWKRTLKEIDTAMNQGIPILGVCAYPVIDRPDWTDGHLTNSGFWDFKAHDASLSRIPHEPTIKAVMPYIKKWSIYNTPMVTETPVSVNPLLLGLKQKKIPSLDNLPN